MWKHEPAVHKIELAAFITHVANEIRTAQAAAPGPALGKDQGGR
jgi:hypothetical protein